MDIITVNGVAYTVWIMSIEAPEGMVVYIETGAVNLADQAILVKESQYYVFSIGVKQAII